MGVPTGLPSGCLDGVLSRRHVLIHPQRPAQFVLWAAQLNQPDDAHELHSLPPRESTVTGGTSVGPINQSHSPLHRTGGILTSPGNQEPLRAPTIRRTLPQVKELYSDSPPYVMAHSATISSKGQITLPKELRDRHHLHPGERIILLDSREGVLLRHGKTGLRGSLKGKIDSASFEKELRRLRREWSF